MTSNLAELLMQRLPAGVCCDFCLYWMQYGNGHETRFQLCFTMLNVGNP